MSVEAQTVTDDDAAAAGNEVQRVGPLDAAGCEIISVARAQ